MINGNWQPQWASVVAAFEQNFVAMGEQGAGLAVYWRGELALNIWGGTRDNRLAGITHQAWDEASIVNIFSAGKGLVALCILRLVAQGQLQLDAPIAQYWPEFAQAGKADITLRQVLCHRSGLSAFNERISDPQIFNWSLMTAAIAQEAPWWQPNTQQGYSPFMYGWILGELVRRVSGYASFGEYFQQEVAVPLGVNCFFGVPDDVLATIADTGPLKRPLGSSTKSGDANSNSNNSGADSIALGKFMKADPRGVTNRAFSNPITLMTASNSLAWRQAHIPAANAHANAAALATLYGQLAQSSSSLLAEAELPRCWQEQTFSHDQVLGLPLRFSHGFMLSQAQRGDCRFGRGERAFGHPGAGGCLGFADPDYELGFGYVTSRMGQSLLIDERAITLIDAVYAVLEKQ